MTEDDDRERSDFGNLAADKCDKTSVGEVSDAIVI